jgi:hypothetical protein
VKAEYLIFGSLCYTLKKKGKYKIQKREVLMFCEGKYNFQFIIFTIFTTFYSVDTGSNYGSIKIDRIPVGNFNAMFNKTSI